MLVSPGEVLGGVKVLGTTFGGKLDGVAEASAKSLLNKVDRKMCDVDADPLPPELLRRLQRRAAATKRVKNNIAGV